LCAPDNQLKFLEKRLSVLNF